jgi:hypothetical protein
MTATTSVQSRIHDAAGSGSRFRTAERRLWHVRGYFESPYLEARLDLIAAQNQFPRYLRVGRPPGLTGPAHVLWGVDGGENQAIPQDALTSSPGPRQGLMVRFRRLRAGQVIPCSIKSPHFSC